MTTRQAVAKRLVDVLLAALGLVLLWWLILLAVVAATLDTRRFGLFVQPRVGKGGRLFPLLKIRTMRPLPGHDTTVTTRADPRITTLGRLMRRAKIDELPQLVNVLAGHMSFVGPRPDVPGFADLLEGHDRIVLTVRPGITGPATLKYRDEEALLMEQDDPERYNREVLFPDKVRINREYIEQYRLRDDFRYLLATLRLPGSET